MVLPRTKHKRRNDFTCRQWFASYFIVLRVAHVYTACHTRADLGIFIYTRQAAFSKNIECIHFQNTATCKTCVATKQLWDIQDQPCVPSNMSFQGCKSLFMQVSAVLMYCRQTVLKIAIHLLIDDYFRHSSNKIRLTWSPDDRIYFQNVDQRQGIHECKTIF